jgi:hypothetical protein
LKGVAIAQEGLSDKQPGDPTLAKPRRRRLGFDDEHGGHGPLGLPARWNQKSTNEEKYIK